MQKLICRQLASLLVCTLLFCSGVMAQTVITGLSTNKALYGPGSTVTFKATLNQSQSGVSLRVRYYHLSSLLNTVNVSFTGTTPSWTWTLPANDNRGYMVGVELMNGTSVLSSSSIGVNVASNFNKFPIYGFLSKFPSKTDWEMDVQMDKLNRYHINAVQFYDWMDTHHDPLAGTPSAPTMQWNDLANRPTYFNTVKGFVDRARGNYNMKAFFYNLIYGTYSNVPFDANWYLYRSNNGTNIWSNPFPSGWETPSLYMMNLSNTNWRSYFLGKANEVYTATNLNFDGWHMDQLGDWGFMYTKTGTQVDVAQTFPGFIDAAKAQNSNKLIGFNAVNTYGQSLIANKALEFLYTEMWTGNEDYKAFRNVISTNEGYNASLKNIFAAYVGRSRSGSTGVHSHGAVLMADAAIFAAGGMHIELGEHLLCNEYFPNSNLSMSANLEAALKQYYDFAVGYENILRDGRTFNNVALSGTGVQAWPPALGKITTFGASWKGNQVFHCLNYSNASTLNWQDDQPEPTTKTNIAMSFPFSTTVTRLWVASPDFNNGLPQNLSFTQANGTVSFTLPNLKYWTMVVAETGTTPATARQAQAAVLPELAEAGQLAIAHSAPNPFVTSTTISYTVPVQQHVRLELYNMDGAMMRQLVNGEMTAGKHQFVLDGHGLAAGSYTCVLTGADGSRRSIRIIKIK